MQTVRGNEMERKMRSPRPFGGCVRDYVKQGSMDSDRLEHQVVGNPKHYDPYKESAPNVEPASYIQP